MKGNDFRQTKIAIVGGARTPFGSFCGGLSSVSATELGVAASKAAISKAGIEASEIDQVIFGNVLHSSSNAAYLARHIGLKVGASIETPALTVNRLCGSGMQALVSGAEQILLGRADTVLVGGSENMTQAPFTLWDARKGIGLGQAKMGDALWDALSDEHIGLKMGETADQLATDFGISRDESDRFSEQSHLKYFQALKRGFFEAECTPVSIQGKKGVSIVEGDEHPRSNIQFEKLNKLPPVFHPEGTVTAGSASGICDGASALIVMSEEKAKRLNLDIWAELVAYEYTGCAPDRMGLGPVGSIQRLLKNMGTKVSDIDLFEVNEAFAPQVLAVCKALNVPMSKVNIHGGAIALGHPLGASGARIALTLVRSMMENKLNLGVASACIGGGQGIAIAVSKPS